MSASYSQMAQEKKINDRRIDKRKKVQEGSKKERNHKTNGAKCKYLMNWGEGHWIFSRSSLIAFL